MKRNSVFFVMLVCITCVLVFGCKSTGPTFYSFSESTPYVVLGEVTYSSNNAVEGLIGGTGSASDLLTSGAGYLGLLAAAKAKYPGCDYVIDVMIDTTVTNYLIISSSVYSLRGTAIRYVR